MLLQHFNTDSALYAVEAWTRKKARYVISNKAHRLGSLLCFESHSCAVLSRDDLAILEFFSLTWIIRGISLQIPNRAELCRKHFP